MTEFETILQREKRRLMDDMEKSLVALLHMEQRAGKYSAALRSARALVDRMEGATLISFISYSSAEEAAHLEVYVYGLDSLNQAAPIVRAFVLALGRSVKEHHRGPSGELHLSNDLVRLTFHVKERATGEKNQPDRLDGSEEKLERESV